MVQFIFTSILMVSLSVVLYLMARALPRIVEEPQAEKPGILDRWAHSQFPEKVDLALNGFLLKFLRKFKVLVLKLDNTLSKHLQKVKVEESGKKPAIDFKEIAGQNKESENGGSN
ncbi:MAG TPA: hypothetical protein VHZ04_01665 [Candidatus Paceibacterota bacterium]|jgi:hypothetical protein|nr:hypothetical protein [Candidatus Paceibacterota bacterium]